VTAATQQMDSGSSGLIDRVRGLVFGNAWGLGLVAFFALLLVFTKFIQPSYGGDDFQGLTIGVVPLALAAAAQAVIVISGGIDLSIGSMMALTSVVAASQMKGQSEEFAVVVVIGVIILGLILGAVNGALIVLTKVPDIIVTLAMSFVWAGAALLVLATPGGGAAEWFKQLILGDVGVDIIPKALVVMLVAVVVIWIPLQRSRHGLALYAIGSSQLAAFRSGVSVNRSKILAYTVGGLFAALAGLSLVSSTRIGTPVPGPDYTLLSVAAIVLGGVNLAGGRGGLFGPIVAVFILQMLRTDLTFLRVNTNLATVMNGVILVGVVMLGSLIQLRRSRRR
jgi:ribose transport system permease protein